MRQVLDLVELMEKADEVEGGDVRVVWLLRHASTNSPFTVRAESSSSDPSIVVSMRASRAARTFQQGISSLLETGHAPEWMDHSSLRVAKRVLERNLNGIGRTDIDLGSDGSLLILPGPAQKGVLAIEKAFLDEKLAAPNLTRTEFGSVEGEIVAAASYYQRPALMIRERLSEARVNCVLSEEAARQVGPEHNWSEVWSRRRVIISGALHYGADGTIARIDADFVEPVNEVEVSLGEIRDMNLTDGLGPVEYLNLLRGLDDA